MHIKEFSLAWRWTQSSHAKLPEEVLKKLHPLSLEEAKLVADSLPQNFPPGATRYTSLDEEQTAIQWLVQLPISEQRIIISWDDETAISLPWSVFCEFWDDFCYPSSDDVDICLENGQHFLRWNHYEVFEYDSSAI